MNNKTIKQSIYGLSQQEALHRLESFGHNELKTDQKNSLFHIFLNALKEPMVLLLIGIGMVYVHLGETEEIYSLAAFLALILGITIYQENKTEQTLHALKELSSPRAVVIRDGKQIRIPGRDVVIDDVVVLSEGDRIPADIKLIKGGPLSVDESIITGESFPVEKGAKPEQVNFVLSGTLILRGQALGIVMKTGAETELGKIGKSLEEKKSQSSPLQISTRKVVTKLSLLVTALTFFIVIYYWLTRNDLLNGILTGLTLAMAILPNELPAVLLIFLAAGAWRISKRNVLTRKVPSIEALGGITHLCVDKTGTLTQNMMVLRELWNGKESLDLQTQTKKLPEDFHDIMEFGILASPTNPFDPMERALKKTGSELLVETEHLHPTWTLSKEYQISNELLAVSYAWKGEEKNGYVVGAKGAVEAIIDLCHISQGSFTHIENQMIKMAKKGLRVLAIARSFSQRLPQNQHDLEFEFLGLIGFEDPIRVDAFSSIEECQNAGVKVLMITGDHPATAKSIAQQIGLKNPLETLTGSQIQELDDKELARKLDEVHIYCRMKPLDKLRIVSVLQASGQVVAMTGDGVNDAPALRKAQIGIAMGKRGTDVAREASSVVLLDDSFSSIVAAIRIGRRIFSNLRKASSYLLTIHIPITVLSVAPVMMKLPALLLPVHIAFLHLIIEPASTMIFEALPERGDLMTEPPRTNSRLLSNLEIFESLLTGIVLSASSLGIYLYTLTVGLDETDARGITFLTLIVTNLMLIFLKIEKTESGSIKGHLRILVIGTCIMLATVFYIPFFRSLFRFNYMHLHDFIPSVGVSIGALLLMTLVRMAFLRAKPQKMT